jgi:hypothetical protein
MVEHAWSSLLQNRVSSITFLAKPKKNVTAHTKILHESLNMPYSTKKNK